MVGEDTEIDTGEILVETAGAVALVESAEVRGGGIGGEEDMDLTGVETNIGSGTHVTHGGEGFGILQSNRHETRE